MDNQDTYQSNPLIHDETLPRKQARQDDVGAEDERKVGRNNIVPEPLLWPEVGVCKVDKQRIERRLQGVVETHNDEPQDEDTTQHGMVLSPEKSQDDLDRGRLQTSLDSSRPQHPEGLNL